MSTVDVETIHSRIQAGVDYLKNKLNRRPDIGVILGSGLGELADETQDKLVIPYTDIPEFPRATAPGHKGNLVFGTLGGKSVMLMQGRIHTYEGYSQPECTMPVVMMKELGVKTMIVTAATGGLNYNHKAGDLMLIRDHINFTGTNPLVGPNDEKVGPRFPVMFDAYCPELREVARQVALKQGLNLHEGVYCGVQGPVFFTKSELRMLMLWGADSIGMSTVPEVIVAVHRGMKVLGIAVVSDIAIPDSGAHATEAEVLETARQTGPRFRQLVKGILEAMP
ncbi:MAG: purine-nucleoside phosphorylase [Candidatus Eremiobacteraeota bacterium]|nr:purine-nucleoside phosphorylase [Candidatus Eremiobacteraeota bacterium]